MRMDMSAAMNSKLLIKFCAFCMGKTIFYQVVRRLSSATANRARYTNPPAPRLRSDRYDLRHGARSRVSRRRKHQPLNAENAAQPLHRVQPTEKWPARDSPWRSRRCPVLLGFAMRAAPRPATNSTSQIAAGSSAESPADCAKSIQRPSDGPRRATPLSSRDSHRKARSGNRALQPEAHRTPRSPPAQPARAWPGRCSHRIPGNSFPRFRPRVHSKHPLPPPPSARRDLRSRKPATRKRQPALVFARSAISPSTIPIARSQTAPCAAPPRAGRSDCGSEKESNDQATRPQELEQSIGRQLPITATCSDLFSCRRFELALSQPSDSNAKPSWVVREQVNH